MIAPAAAAPPALSERAAAELDERRLLVVAEQAVGLRWQILLTATIVAAIVWQSVPPAAVLAWFAAVIGSRELRAAALAHMAADRQRPIAERLRATVRWNVLIGACNGSAALFMAWLDPSLDAVLTMILVSWGAGAVSTSATVMRAFLAYASLLFVPTAIMWALSATWLGVGVAALVLMFFGVQFRFARRNQQTFEESFRIRQENEELATSLEFERAQLAVARDAAVRANQDKSRFLAAASHDLRQPLQAMALNVGALRHLPMGQEARQVSEVVDGSLGQLCSMLDALLDVSKLDAGVVVAQPRRVQLERLVAAVMGSFGAAAAGRQVALDWSCPPELAVHTDPDLMRRMLANLVDNAIKFTPAGGRVQLQVVAYESDAELTVRDTGPGIAAQHHHLIFEDLVRLGAGQAASAGGHGLGLGIVRRMADLLKVPIALESAPGAGAAFRLRLPLVDPAQAAADAAVPAWSLAGRRVLVLDDDSMVRGAYVNALAAMGCHALAAATLEDAVAQLSSGGCDAAVVDFHLGGGVDGLEAVERLRALEPSLPMVMVSADKDDAVVGTARKHALALLRKPVDAPTLGRTVSAAIASVQ
ncbi:hybrid sensor histidine kinase/response regulator [Variovorax sp. OV329]|uniref:hybrid sensor histidine kinase/response regulator n=1 Tax=Variovorax sp. OV329 TaxID=1882825 RepID=UPI0008E54F42|nr:hybrid sensor histidine kinase/response regulator [Variovorax sp. OV329]SFN41795.1 Signal transduction histidine kinase [Variovorax sp. OV329]